MIDVGALLDFLDAHAENRSPLVSAIYSGLAVRVRRGDFDALDGGR